MTWFFSEGLIVCLGESQSTGEAVSGKGPAGPGSPGAGLTESGDGKGYCMAEIKSTLDLVMERTRNLTLTREERQVQTLEEFRKNLAGLILKFQESAISLDRLNHEVEALRESSGVGERSVLVAEVAGRLDLEKENDRLLDILREVCGADVSRIISLLDDCRDAVVREKDLLGRRKIEELAEKHGIRGPAVRPNPDAAEEWPERRRDILNRFGTGPQAGDRTPLKALPLFRPGEGPQESVRVSSRSAMPTGGRTRLNAPDSGRRHAGPRAGSSPGDDGPPA